MKTFTGHGEQMNVLYFDLECRPGHWIGGDFVSKVITAAAWAWNGDDPALVTHYERTPGEIARMVADKLDEADMVVGHYIRGFDLPLLNGELMRNDDLPLSSVLALDTKLDLMTVHGRSQSQENLASQLGLEEPKVKVTLPEWEAFNGREDGADHKVRERVYGDVIQNRAMREALAEMGWLGAPNVWRPEKTKSGGFYRP